MKDTKGVGVKKMTGKQHLTAGATLSVLSVTAYQGAVHTYTNETALSVISAVKDFVIPQSILLWPVCILFLFIGFLAPDCDNNKSMLGRYIHIPFEHRTWTHTIWFCIVFCLLGLLFKPFWSLGFGVFLHLLCDSFSKCGVCWFFPNYKHYGHGKIKKGHFMKLYTSEPMAWIWCGVLMTFTLLYLLGTVNVIGPIHSLIGIVHSFTESCIVSVANVFS